MDLKPYLASQEELGIFLSCLEPTLAYNLPLLVPLGKDADASKAESAIRAILDNHPYLNAVFFLGEGGALYKRLEPLKGEFHLPVVKGLHKDKLVQHFDILEKHLYRFGFIQDQDQSYLFADFHHILMDGFSLDMFLSEFASVYEGRGKGKKETYSSFDFALEKAAARQDKERFAKDEAFYKESFDGIDVDSLIPQEKDEGKVAYGKFALPLPKLHDHDVRALLQKLNIRRSAFFLAAFAYTLGIYSFSDEASFLSVNNGRNEKVKESYGMYVRTFPMYLNHMNEGRVDDFLKATDQKQKDILAHDSFSFSDVVSATGFNADILFAYQGEYFYSTELGGKKSKWRSFLSKMAKRKSPSNYSRRATNISPMSNTAATSLKKIASSI